MKKSLLYLASVLAIAGCAKETLVGNEEENPNEGQKLYIIGNVVDTKTTHNDYDAYIGTTWNLDDEIGIFAYKDGGGTNEVDIMLNYKGTYKKEASEDGSDFYYFDSHYYILYQQGVKYDLYAYYPYQKGQTSEHSVKVTVPEVQIQKEAGNIEHLKSTDLLYGHNYYAWSSSDPDKGKLNQKVHMDFYHALSVLEISLTSSEKDVSISSVTATIEDEAEVFSVSDGELDIATGKLTLTAGSPSIKVQLGTSAVLSETASKVYMQITPGHAGKVLSIYAYVNGNKQKLGSVKVPASGIPTGVKAALTFDVVAQSVTEDYIDLSTEGTANCYIVNQADKTYRFNAKVMGNGKLPDKLSSVVSVDEIDPKSALVLWYAPLSTDKNDVTNAVSKQPVIVESVKVQDGYIYFSTPETFVDGNVVIVAFAEEGLKYDNITVDSETRTFSNATVLWSWNIWCVKDYDINAPENQLTFGTTILADRNLGALLDGSDIVYDSAKQSEAYRASYVVGNLYQFGRKDPSPSFFGYTSYLSDYVVLYEPNFTPILALQQESGSLFVKGGINRISTDDSASLGDAVAKSVLNPHLYMVANNFVYSWTPLTNNSFRYLWGGEDQNISLEKTAYDPCPVGWKLWDAPTSNAVIQAVQADESKYFKANGIYSIGTCFPFSGYGRRPTGDNMKEPLMPYTGWPSNGTAGVNLYTSISTSTGLCYPGYGTLYEPMLYISTKNSAEGPIATYHCDGYKYNNGALYAMDARPARCIKE